METVGFIGLGLMGGPMAANVAKSDFSLTVYNRSPDKSEPLLALGAKAATSPAEAAAAADAIVLMLSDAAAVESVLFGLQGVASAAKDGAVVIDMSTIAPDQSIDHARRLEQMGLSMLDAPVYGSTGPAAAGTLGILVGGPAAAVEAHRPLLESMGSVFHFGPQGSGALAKIAFNLMVAGQMTSLAEAMVLAAKGGLDLEQFGRMVTGSGISSNLIERKVRKIVEMDDSPAFPLKHMQKDLGLMVRTADMLGSALPATGVLHQMFTAARERGLADKDFAAIYWLMADLAGLAVPTEEPQQESGE